MICTLRRCAVAVGLGAFLSALGAPSPAQQPAVVPGAAVPGAPASAAFPLQRPAGRVFVDTNAGSRIWARGDDWKASFGADGMAFVPFLGSTAERNWPVAVGLQAALAGGGAVALRPGQVRAHGSERVTIDRGALLETFELSATGVEQRFVFARRPAAGDLAVVLALQTELSVVLLADGSVRCGDELGGVTIGRATAVDARGANAPCTTALVGTTLTWTVPAAFVASAVLPLTIDPLVQTFTLPGSQVLTDGAPDVAFVDSLDGCDVFVYEEYYSATDTDVLVLARSADGLASSSYYVDFTTDDWRGPRIAANLAASQFLCVAQQRTGSIIPTARVAARLMDYSVSLGQPLLNIGAVFPVSTASFLTSRAPDVGGDADLYAVQPGNYCVTWTDGGLLYYNLVDVNGGVAFPGGLVVPFVSLFPVTRPAISKSCGAVSSGAHEWVIVYEKTISSGNRDIWGTRIRVDGLIVDQHFPIVTGADDDTAPEVSSPADQLAGEPWMVVWQRNVPAGPTTIGQADIRGAIFAGSTSLTGDVNLTSLFARSTSRNQVRPCVDSDGIRFAVGFSEDVSTFSVNTVPLVGTAHLTPASGIGVTSFPESLSGYFAGDDRLQIASRHSGGASNTFYSVAWEAQPSGTQLGEAKGAVYLGHTNLPEASYFNNVLPGCGSLLLVPQGRPALGESFYLHLLNEQGFPVLILGSPVAPQPLCSGCDLGIDPTTAILLAQTIWATIVPPDVALLGASFGAQGIDVFAPGGCGPSLLGVDFTLSNEIVVTIL